MKKSLVVLFCGLALTAVVSIPVSAAPVGLLVPVYAKKVPGAAGSVWSTDLRVFNGGDSVAFIAPPCLIAPCLVYQVQPGMELDPVNIGDETTWVAPQPFFLFTDTESLGKLQIQLRVFDESRSALNWGTWVPVIDFEKEKARAFWFVRIPAAAPFRNTLRIYGATSGITARVRYFDAENNALLIDRVIPLGTGRGDAFAELGSAGMPELGNARDVRIQVTANDDVWAMVSVTNNETQVVTVIPGEKR